MSGGSLIWGQVASVAGIPTALLIAAAGALVLIPLTWRAELGQGEMLDLAPSAHWPEPVVTLADAEDRGPVMIQIADDAAHENQAAFRTAMANLARARRRGGGYGWTLMQDAEEPSRFVETWFEASWIGHLRHHERVSGQDRALQDNVLALHRGDGPPKAHNLLGANGKIS